MTTSISGGTAAVAHVGALDASAVKELQDTLCNGASVNLTGATDAIPFPSIVAFLSTGVDAATLATPVAGPQPAGDDGKEIFMIDLGGHAHTVTCAANKIVNSKHLLTWNGTVGSNVTLIANNGIWLISGTPNGVTVS